MGYNSLIQSIIRKMPSSPFVLATYMNDATKDINEYLIANKGEIVYPMVIVNKNYQDGEPDEQVSEVWLKGVSIYIVVETTINKQYEQRETEVFEGVLFPLRDELINTLKRSYKFNFTNRGNNTVVPHSVTRMPYILSESVSQNMLNTVVDCLEVRFDNLKVLNN